MKRKYTKYIKHEKAIGYDKIPINEAKNNIFDIVTKSDVEQIDTANQGERIYRSSKEASQFERNFCSVKIRYSFKCKQIVI